MIDEPQPQPDKKKKSLGYGSVWGVIYICVCVCGGQEKYMRGGCTGDKMKEASRTEEETDIYFFVSLFVCATKTGQSKRALNRGERGTQTLYKTRESSGIHMYY